MEIETESEQTYEPILNIGGGNIEESERSEQFMIETSELCFIDRDIIVLCPTSRTHEFATFKIAVVGAADGEQKRNARD